MDIIEADSEEAVAEILKAGQKVEIVGAGTKLALGRPVEGARRLSLAAISGIVSYEPAELILSVRAATPMAEIDAALAAHSQTLAFEPPDLSRLLGSSANHQTIGGVVATALAGPRRCVAGGVRDHLLGLTAVNGRGEIFKAGGRVVKNVTGYDLCKLLAGSFGTMAVFTELTLKVLPAAETEESVVLVGLDGRDAVSAMCAALGSSAGISGAAWLPGEESLTVLRIEGFASSVTARRHRLVSALGLDTALWSAETSRNWWRDLRDVAPLVGLPDQAIWKISLAATQAPALLKKLAGLAGCRLYLDWGGAMIWLAVDCGGDAQAGALRALLPDGAHAMLMVAPPEIRTRVPVFQPLPVAQAAVEEKVRRSFDPDHLLNPGRMSPC